MDTNEQLARREKLEQFFLEVARLTVDHNVLETYPDGLMVAAVFPKDLGKALELVDPEWWEHIREEV